MVNLTVVTELKNQNLYEELLFAYGALSVSSTPLAEYSIQISAIFDSSEILKQIMSTPEFNNAEIEPVSDGWNNNWLKFAKAVYLDDKTVVVPEGKDTVFPDYVSSITIKADDTFGFGSHPTTLVCAELLNKTLSLMKHREADVYDLGCGSGVLSIYASLLGARSVVGIDSDYKAVEISKYNANLNSVSNCEFFNNEISQIFIEPDSICVINVPISVLEINMNKLIEACNNNVILIISGFTSQYTHIIKQNLSFSFNAVEIFEKNEWVGALISPSDTFNVT
jgi:ribosomal protein L11 methyltransferase